MSANPFRKSVQPQPIATTEVNGTQPLPIKSNIIPSSLSSERKVSKGKRVRIQTPPPLSPDTPAEEYKYPVWPTAPIDRDTASPPPPLTATTEPFVLPFPAVDHGLEQELQPDQEVLDNTRRNSAGDSAGLYTNGGTFNPFAKTLESIESKYNGKKEQSTGGSGINWAAAETAAAAKRPGPKPAMDVDSFKRLLMTGKAGEAASTENVQAARTSFAPSPSSLAQDVRTASSSTNDVVESSDRSDLESASSDEDSHDHSQRDQEVLKAERLSPSAPIRPTASQGPQTVSFSEWDTFDSALPSRGNNNAAPTGSDPLSLSAPRPPPVPTRRLKSQTGETPADQASAALSSQQIAPPPPRSRQTSTSETPSPGTTSPNPPKAPSPLPLPVPPRRRAHSNLSTNSATSSLDMLTTDAPPPPITQRPRRGDSTASNASTGAGASKPAAPPPPPPARRFIPKPLTQPDSADPANLATSAQRTSISSISMPPPPPPRRRGSSKGSIDLSDSRRGSYADRPARTSVESVRPSVRVVQDQSQDSRSKSDMFADLDALQKEVEALRRGIR